jgi:hypothetical protein
MGWGARKGHALEELDGARAEPVPGHLAVDIRPRHAHRDHLAVLGELGVLLELLQRHSGEGAAWVALGVLASGAFFGASTGFFSALGASVDAVGVEGAGVDVATCSKFSMRLGEGQCGCVRSGSGAPGWT